MGQACAQLPQFEGSYRVSTHMPLQVMRVIGQIPVQDPPMHTCEPAHSARQVPPQLARPPPHDAWQDEPVHTWPGMQAVPHAPQLARSVVRSRHTPPHSTSPPPQDS